MFPKIEGVECIIHSHPIIWLMATNSRCFPRLKLTLHEQYFISLLSHKRVVKKA